MDAEELNLSKQVAKNIGSLEEKQSLDWNI